jgi:hypothetical protein
MMIKRTVIPIISYKSEGIPRDGFLDIPYSLLSKANEEESNIRIECRGINMLVHLSAVRFLIRRVYEQFRDSTPETVSIPWKKVGNRKISAAHKKLQLKMDFLNGGGK